MSFAEYSDRPPYYNRQNEVYFDSGNGIPQMDENNMTQQDIFRTPFLFTQEHRRDYNTMVKTAEKTISFDSDLNKIFFSDKNIKRIQRKIRDTIYVKTKGEYRLIIDQDEQDLIIVMSTIFKEHAKHLPNQIVRQIKKLNNIVVEAIIPDMITSIKQYYGYLKDVNEPIKPMDRPVNLNNAGRLTLPSITTSFGV